VGCREVVDEGVNGYLCRPRDVFDLADKMARIEKLSIADLEVMGASGRKKMESEFDERFVINKYLEEIASILELQKRRNG
jgi:glycosyltransferase involved in cell wall biosynthesis